MPDHPGELEDMPIFYGRAVDDHATYGDPPFEGLTNGIPTSRESGLHGLFRSS